MAQPFDNAATLNLSAISAVIQQQYAPFLGDEIFFNSGTVTNRLFNPDPDPVVGDGKTYQAVTRKGLNARFNTDSLADFQNPSQFQAGSLKIRMNERDASSSDMTRLGGVARISELELLGVSSDGACLDIAERVVNDLTKDADLMLAIHRHLPRSGLVASTSSTSPFGLKNSNLLTYSGSSQYTAGSTTCRIQLSSGTGNITALPPGAVIDFYQSGVRVFAGAVVVSQNPYDQSLSLARYDSNSTTNFDSISTAGSDIYYSGMYGKNMYSFGAWFTRPVAGDSFINGVSRLTDTNQWLLPTATREDQSSATKVIDRYDLDVVGDAVGYITDAPMTEAVFFGDPKLITTLRQDIGEDNFSTIAYSGEDGGDRWAKAGNVGVIYQHPTLGRCRLIGDPLAVPNTLRMVIPGDWITATYGQTSFRFLPGNINDSMWSRLPAASPNSGFGMFYQTEMYRIMCDFCKYPRRQAQIMYITP